MNRKEQEAMGYLYQRMQRLVRESGYDVCLIKNNNAVLGEDYSRAYSLWEEAKRALLDVARLLGLEKQIDAEIFITNTYNPDINKMEESK